MAQEKILNVLPSDQLRLYVVWTPVLREDNRAAAVEAMTLVSGERVTQFWDADKSLGLTFGNVVDLPRDRTLGWDVYFVFKRDLEWDGEQPPVPTDWMHQLGTDERLLNGLKLHETVKTLLQAPH